MAKPILLLAAFAMLTLSTAAQAATIDSHHVAIEAYVGNLIENVSDDSVKDLREAPKPETSRTGKKPGQKKPS